MAKRKKKQEPGVRSDRDLLGDLAAEAAMLPDSFLDSLDDELADVVNSEARLMLENIQNAVLLDKIEYLYERGYTVERIRQLIAEARKGS